jgi:hypothetical protein
VQTGTAIESVPVFFLDILFSQTFDDQPLSAGLFFPLRQSKIIKMTAVPIPKPSVKKKL